MAFKRNKKTVSQLQAYVYDKLCAGDTIVLTLLPDGVNEYTLASGFRMHSDTFKALRDRGLIKPQGDALIADLAQTWVRA